MSKSISHQKARELRKQGLGIKTIAHQLRVSSSTTSLWCRDIQLNAEQIQELERRSHDPFYGKRLENVRKQQKLRALQIEHLFKKGIKDVASLTKKELFAAGISLYWGEGFKKDSQVGFANSDPSMLKFFVFWLEKCCGITKDRLRFRIGINESYKDKITTVQEFWSRYLNINENQFQKPFFQKVKWKKVYDNPETYFGVLRVRVTKSTNLLRLFRGWIEGLRINTSK